MGFYKFLQDEPVSRTEERNDLNPTVIALELGEGIEELNTELIKMDVLNKAAISLDKSIELDNQIAVSGVANKGTVSYGIEALEATAIFLGVDNINFDELAAGLEDNDQEGAADKKKDFLAKVKDAARKTWNAIIEFIKKIISKVKEFFQSKAIEEGKKELAGAAKEVEKAVGAENKKPECKSKKLAETEKVAIAGLFPVYINEVGLKTSKDFADIVDYLSDKGPIEALEAYKNSLSKDTVEVVKVLKELAKGNNKEASQIKTNLSKISLDFIKNFKIVKVKQHPAKEKIIKEYEEEILEAAGMKDNKGDYEYTVIFTGDSVDKKTGDVSIKATILAKNTKQVEIFEKALETADTEAAITKAVSKMSSILVKKDVTVKTKLQVSKIAEKVEPFSAAELKDLETKLDNFKKQAKAFLDNVEKETEEIRKSVEKIAGDLKDLEGIGSSVEAFITNALNTAATVVRTGTDDTIKPVTKLLRLVIRLTKNCAEGKEDKTGNPLA